MFTRFHTDTLTTNFIKHLVDTTPLPTIQSWKPGDFVVKGLSYVTQSNVVVALKTGNPLSEYAGDFKILYPYVFGNKYKGMTSSYRSNIKGYDSKTHYCLGQYLRFVRDLQGLNLMPLYNCFNDEYARGISIQAGDALNQGTIELAEDDNYKLLLVPVKFNQSYTVGLESPFPIHYGYIFYSDTGYEQEATYQLNTLLANPSPSTQLVDIGKRGIIFKSKSECSIKKPFVLNTLRFEDIVKSITTDEGTGDTYDFSYTITTFAAYEKYLKLVIRIPKTLNTSVVVLEGDYQSSFKYMFRDKKVVLAKAPEVIQGDATMGGKKNSEYPVTPIIPSRYVDLISQLSLMQLNDTNTYAFSNRLMEYLSLNVITPHDRLSDNIKRIQYYAEHPRDGETGKSDSYKPDSIPGVWSKSLKEYLFNRTMDSDASKLDLLGYVDKDVERVVTTGYIPTWEIGEDEGGTNGR